MRVTESTAIVKYHGHGHYKHFFKGVYYRAVKVSSRLEVGMRVLSTFEVFIDIRNSGGGKKKINLETGFIRRWIASVKKQADKNGGKEERERYH